MMRRAFAFAAIVALSSAAVASCTPGQRDAVPAVTRAACVLLHAIFNDGTTDTVCATAEDLAPFIGPIIASKAEREPEAAPMRPMVSFAVAELPSPVRRVARRRCVAWVPVSRSSAEGGSDAALE